MRKFFLEFIWSASLVIAGCGGKHHSSDNEQLTPAVANTPTPVPSPPRTETEVTLGELQCTDKVGLITNCRFKDRVLAEKQAALSKFILNYKFNCVGEKFAIAALLDDLEVPLKQEENPTLTIYGFGPFSLKDTDPALTREAYVQPGCKLEIVDFKVEAV